MRECSLAGAINKLKEEGTLVPTYWKGSNTMRLLMEVLRTQRGLSIESSLWVTGLS